MKNTFFQIVLFIIAGVFSGCGTDNKNNKSQHETGISEKAKTTDLVLASKNDSSEKYFREGLNLIKDNGYFLTKRKDSLIYYKAAIQIEKAIEFNNSNVEYYHSLANIYIDLDSTDRAIEIFEKAIEMYPEHIEIRTALGFLFEKNENLDKATELYKKAFELYQLKADKQFADKINQMFLNLLLNGEDSAVKDLKRIRQEFPGENVDFYEMLILNFNRADFVAKGLK